MNVRSQIDINADRARLEQLRDEIESSPFPSQEKQTAFFALAGVIAEDIADLTGEAGVPIEPDQPYSLEEFSRIARATLEYVELQFTVPSRIGQ
jgi:hypothetical protein